MKITTKLHFIAALTGLVVAVQSYLKAPSLVSKETLPSLLIGLWICVCCLCVYRGRFCGLCAAEGEYQQLYRWRWQDLLLLHGEEPGADRLPEPDQSVQDCPSLQGQREDLTKTLLTIIMLIVPLGFGKLHHTCAVLRLQGHRKKRLKWGRRKVVIWSTKMVDYLTPYVTDTEGNVNGFRETFPSQFLSLSCLSPRNFRSEWTSSWVSLILVSSMTVVHSVLLLPGKLHVHHPTSPMANALPLFIAILPSTAPPPLFPSQLISLAISISSVDRKPSSHF